MLLLVLILVVIAFGLLVVALLSTSVLWAWVSVGVSVVAAVVLLVDWLQRRAAAKAGAMPALAPASGGPALGSGRPAMTPPRADLDPATEVLPVVPPAARGAAGPDSPTVAASAPQQLDSQPTVVMPAVQPSGSPARPPGADPTFTSSSAISSPNVTNGESDRSASAFGSGAGTPPASSTKAPDAGAPSAADTPAPDGGSATPEPTTGPDKVGLGKAPAVTAAAGAAAAAAAVVGAKGGDADAPAAAPEQPGPEQSGPEQSGSEQPGSEASATGAGPAAPTSTAAAPRPPEPAVTSSDPDAESTVAVEAHPGTPPGGPAIADIPASDIPASDAPAAGAAPADAVPNRDAPAGAAPASEQVDLFGAPAPVEPPSSAEAPEEPHDPVAAGIVSGLDDEVVVVDEQPRYHVSECRALASVAIIPLPVREAVELGFTPCGWCSPDRTLAGRHQTASR